jgi:hypothetical protein
VGDTAEAALRRRLLLAAAAAPSEAEAEAAQAAQAKASAERAAHEAARAAAACVAEERRLARLASLQPVPAVPPSRVSWVDELEGILEVRQALLESGTQRVGIDTEWADGATQSVGDAVLATVQLAITGGSTGGDERSFVVCALASEQSYRRELASLLRSLLLTGGDDAPQVVGFAFAAEHAPCGRTDACTSGL